MSCFVFCFICSKECSCHSGYAEERGEATKAFFGRSESTFWNVVTAPFALLWHALYTYFFMCIWVYLTRALNHTFCFLCIKYDYFNEFYEFVDTSFPSADEKKKLKNKFAADQFEFLRARDFCKNPKLFHNKATPRDIVQGTIGNGWLLSALVAMAEHPGLVSKTFLTRERSTRGKYSLRLYNAFEKRWEIVYVDDSFPFVNGRAVFAQALGDEIWVMVLEKALAKLRGSYSAILTGNSLWAMRALTGDHVFRLTKYRDSNSRNWKERNWQRVNLIDKSLSEHPLPPYDLEPTEEYYTDADGEMNVFDLLRQYDRKKSLICASTRPSSDGATTGVEKDENTGLIKGQTYAVLRVERVGRGFMSDFTNSEDPEFMMVQLRNPWKQFEWKGFWADGNSRWFEHPKVREALRPNVAANGTFWMEWNDFIDHFDTIDVCDRTVDYSEFQLEINESDDLLTHWAGPTIGCITGCTEYWCLCNGVRTLYFGNESSKYTNHIENIGGADDTFVAQCCPSFAKNNPKPKQGGVDINTNSETFSPA